MPNDRDPDDDAALDLEDDGSDASLPGEPSDSDETTPATTGTTDRDIRNRAAQLGREAAQARRDADEARQVALQQARETQVLREQLGQVQGYLTQQEQRRRDAYLASLPPDQRTNAELKLLREEVAALRAQPPRTQQPAAQQGPDQETLRLARKIIQDYEDDLGLDDGTVDLKDSRLVWDTEEAFRDSVRRVAKQEARARRETPVAKAKNGAAPKAVADDAKQQARREILDELGVNSRVTARPVGSGSRESASDEIGRLHAGYKSKHGMKAQLDRMREIQEAAKAGR